MNTGIKGIQKVVVSEKIQRRRWEAVHWMCSLHRQ